MSALPPYWKTATRALAKADPVMKSIIDTYKGEALTTRGDPFYSLTRAIVGQQISVKAAESVWKRVEAELKTVNPKTILKKSDEQLRACGLSRSKVIYLKSLADHFHTKKCDHAFFDAMEDHEIIAELTEIKGIGRWSAEMFLIFCLMRPDVFPVADIGVQKAIQRHYTVKDLKKLEKHAEQWKPYRTVATWYLWRSLDPVPVGY
ncbi:MAG: DNA-3-methyladenine glycosylase 2 family protein [Proteobacteria bacterium]|nr:DNA-3-methyladenine glycosylase 2 family protein [Pseudomonadota bacterium]